MVIQTEVGDGTPMCIFELDVVANVLFLGNVVDLILIFHAIGIDHWSSVMATGVAFTLHVSFLLTVTAGNVEVAGAVVLGGRGRTILG
jgi:hypothetical protein